MMATGRWLESAAGYKIKRVVLKANFSESLEQQRRKYFE